MYNVYFFSNDTCSAIYHNLRFTKVIAWLVSLVRWTDTCTVNTETGEVMSTHRHGRTLYMARV